MVRVDVLRSRSVFGILTQRNAHCLSGWVRNGAAWMLARFVKDDKLPGTVRAAGTKSVQEFHKWVSQRDEYARMFYREVRTPSTLSDVTRENSSPNTHPQPSCAGLG